MRRIGLILLCLLVAGAGGPAAASAHHHHQRHRLCDKRAKDHKRFKRCRRKRHSAGPRQHGVSQKQHSVGKASADPAPQAPALPPLPQLIAPETACPGQVDESLPPASQEATMGCMINFARGEAGYAGLAAVAALDESSEHKASDLIQCGEFSHTACGRPFTYWLEQAGYLQPGQCPQAGENLAWGTGELGTVRSILTAWVNSPEHLANMLTAGFDQFGVSVETGELQGYPDAHVWVTHFAADC